MTDSDDATRRAAITTTHEDADAARRVAAAVEPDNTPEMETRLDGERVVTTVERGTTGGLRSTVDDYVVNATVAARLATGRDPTDGDPSDADSTDDDSKVADADTADTDTHHE